MVVQWGGGASIRSMSKQAASKAQRALVPSGGGESPPWVLMKSTRAVGDIQKGTGPGDEGRDMMAIVLLVAGGWPVELWMGGIGAGKPWRGRWGVCPVRVSKQRRGDCPCPGLLGGVQAGVWGVSVFS